VSKLRCHTAVTPLSRVVTGVTVSR